MISGHKLTHTKSYESSSRAHIIYPGWWGSIERGLSCFVPERCSGRLPDSQRAPRWDHKWRPNPIGFLPVRLCQQTAERSQTRAWSRAAAEASLWWAFCYFLWGKQTRSAPSPSPCWSSVKFFSREVLTCRLASRCVCAQREYKW